MLRYCRGDIFSTQHWGELFRILNLPEVSVELLEFRHFLKAKSEIKKNIEALKVKLAYFSIFKFEICLNILLQYLFFCLKIIKLSWLYLEFVRESSR